MSRPSGCGLQVVGKGRSFGPGGGDPKRVGQKLVTCLRLIEWPAAGFVDTKIGS